MNQIPELFCVGTIALEYRLVTLLENLPNVNIEDFTGSTRDCKNSDTYDCRYWGVMGSNIQSFLRL
jgi:hypothetical protein